MKKPLLISILLIVLIAGCSKADFSVKISPIDKVYDRGADVPVSFEIENFSFQAGYAIVSYDDFKSPHLRTLNYTIPNITDGYKNVKVELFYDDDSSTGIQDSTKVTVTSPDSQVKFVKPLDGAVLEDTTFDVEVSTIGFGENSTNKGILQILADGKTIAMAGNKATLTLDWREYDLTAQILQNDVVVSSDKIHIRIKPESLTKDAEPNLTIWFPTEGFNVKGDLISVSVKLHDFSIGEPGTERKANQGYLRYLLDGELIEDNVTKASKTINDLPAGTHTLVVQLIQNDGTPYGIERQVTFNARTVTADDKENTV